MCTPPPLFVALLCHLRSHAHVVAVFEGFEAGKSRWVTSKHKDFVWDLDTSDVVAPSNTRLTMSSPGQRHATFHTLSSLLQIGSEDFVFQYEVNAANGFGCDGAYIKLTTRVTRHRQRHREHVLQRPLCHVHLHPSLRQRLLLPAIMPPMTGQPRTLGIHHQYLQIASLRADDRLSEKDSDS